MVNPVQSGKQTRYSFARIKEVMQMPHLLDIQRNSYAWFKNEGLAEIFQDISPITDFTGNLELFFESFTFGQCKYTLDECKRRDGTFAAPVRVKVKLLNKAKGEVKEQEVFMGDFPIMTDTGTFIINGAERVIVSQLVRSPGAYYDKSLDQSGKNVFSATIIPNRGAWIELETDSTCSLFVRIDRTRKMPVTYFLRALDFETNEQILELFDVKYFLAQKLNTLSDADREKLAAVLTSFDARRKIAAVLADFSNVDAGKIATLFVDAFQADERKLLAAQILEGLNAKTDGVSEKFAALLVGNLDFEDRAKLADVFKSFDVRKKIAALLGSEKIDPRDKLLAAYLRHGGGDEASFDRLVEAFGDNLVENYAYLLEKILLLDEKNSLAAAYLALLEQLLADTKNGEDTKEKALIGVYNRLRPGEPPSAENAHQMVNSLFFDPRRYDLAAVGRFKITKKLGWRQRILGKKLAQEIFDPDSGEVLIPAGVAVTEKMLERVDVDREEEIFDLKADKTRGGYLNPIRLQTSTATLLCSPTTKNRTLCVADICAAIAYIFDLQAGVGLSDDIDHLGNRRVRSVGELLQNQFRIGMARMERVVKERMTTLDSEIVTPQNLVNIRPVVAAIKEFFGSSQLSQFMDQHNPLSELTHKRRLSALGPGGLSRERAGFEVRDVHNSHYGRMCPIETPEGPNIGLIGSLATYARINRFGFIETPYRKVLRDKGQGTSVVSNEVVYLTADDEEQFVIASANEPLDEQNRFTNELVTARHHQLTTKIRREAVDFMDVSPKQIVSIATALIPFLENDDANRALMGANMQRQAVPLLRTQAPLVGTGMEAKAASDSGVMILAKRDGVVTNVEADSITVKTADNELDHYKLQKFVRSNQGTCINQIPIVAIGQHVEAGQPIADGPATHMGELALGFNILVAYMPWEGYNYEDAILLNENLIKRDIFTSIHIEEHQCDARETKLGSEDITRDIPNVAEDSLSHLDSDGIVAVGSDVRAGDILVGKVTPKGETELTAEERLLRAIFGEKAREVRDTSLRLPHGQAGKVTAVLIFNRDNFDDMGPGVLKQVRVFIAQKRKISVGDKMSGRHGNKGVVSDIRRQEDMPFLPDGTPVDIVLNPLGVPSRMNIGQILETHLGAAAKKLGLTIATPVFDGAAEGQISDQLKKAGLDEDGKTVLYDGRTGEPFLNRVTVGYVYMLKLHHLVDDKIHARSTGPYSLVTQQPLGGKAQFGGQRFGEMEVWALEAYGAAFSLQEILTVKSDDVQGRVKAYEAIVKGLNIPEPGVPESFKVLIKELQAIGLDIRVLSKDAKDISILDDEDEISAQNTNTTPDSSAPHVEDLADMSPQIDLNSPLVGFEIIDSD